MRTATATNSVVILLLGCCLSLRSHCLVETPKAITADYDVTLEEKDARLSVTAVAASLHHELWLGVDYVPPKGQHGSASHLWKLDKYGKRTADIEVRHPETWDASAKEKGPSVAGIALTAKGPKIYVTYENPSQFWALQLDEAGKLLGARLIVPRAEDASGGIRFSPDVSEAAIIEGAVGLSHLNTDDKMDWSVQLPIKEDEGFILDAIMGDQVFVSAFNQKSESDTPKTQVFSYDRHGKLLQKASLPDLNIGLSVIGGVIQLFQMSPSNDSLAVVLLDPKSLQIQKQSVIPNLHNFAVLLKATGNETALLVSRKDEANTGVLILDENQRQQAYQPLQIDFDIGSLVGTLLGRIFIADNSRVFMIAPVKVFGTIRVISFSLPVS